MNKINLLKIIKLSLGSSLAIFIAWLLNLEYSMVAGVIVLLTVKNTKKETLKGMIGKIYGFILCTLFSYLCFNFLGYHLISFSIFIFIITYICFLLDIQDVIAMCVVISSHYFLQGEISFSWILNEAGIFIIGAGIGVIINMYIPTNINKIYEGQKKLQEEVSTVLIDIADFIVNPNNKDMYNQDLHTLNALIDSSIFEAYNNINNSLLSDTRFFLNHMEIIKNQRDILENLYNYASQLSSTTPQSHIISAFIHKIGYSAFEAETGNLLLDELNRLMLNIRNQPLPKDRVEFENRAILFLCLIELKQFLINRKHAQILRDNNFYK
ncbi:aromatic acid exporter family protein [Romboutsia sp. 13368]|uniref:aromatic acid exporter family protein n=1 Tax=Romboutsia sp. 13368 TaxID=2708053 RepID=UPI0025D4AA40|nr:aromatic acid exporter family protein [Romboutsia sp. 13368]